jgi:hypothetical protein
MRGTRAVLGVGGVAAALLCATTPAVLAAPVQRDVYVESFDGTAHFGAGEDPSGCVPYAGTFHEERSGGYDLLSPGTGQRSDEVKVRGAIDGSVAFTPDRSADGPSYAGSYTERVTGWLVDPDADEFRVASLRLDGRLEGSDGSRLRLLLVMKLTVRPDGSVAAQRESLTCV